MKNRALENALQLVRARAQKHEKALSENEMATRYALIDPILIALGWDVHDPSKVRHEEADNKRAKPDYFLTKTSKKNVPLFLVEAKRMSAAYRCSDIQKYSNESTFQVWTNGKEWRLCYFENPAKGGLHHVWETHVDEEGFLNYLENIHCESDLTLSKARRIAKRFQLQKHFRKWEQSWSEASVNDDVFASLVNAAETKQGARKDLFRDFALLVDARNDSKLKKFVLAKLTSPKNTSKKSFERPSKRMPGKNSNKQVFINDHEIPVETARDAFKAVAAWLITHKHLTPPVRSKQGSVIIGDKDSQFREARSIDGSENWWFEGNAATNRLLYLARYIAEPSGIFIKFTGF